MMIPERPALERRVLETLDGGSTTAGSRIPVVLGGCGTGRTALLLRLRDLIGRNAAQYIAVERIATTPERFLKSVRDTSPIPVHAGGPVNGRDHGARESFAAALAFLSNARGSTGGPVTFLLDEFLELRTFESFPGLRSVLRDLISTLASSTNRFVLTTRYAARAHRLLRDAPSRFEILPVTPLSAAEVRDTLAAADERRPAGFKEDEEDHAPDELWSLIQTLSDGRPAYARMLAESTAALAPRGGSDPVSA